MALRITVALLLVCAPDREVILAASPIVLEVPPDERAMKPLKVTGPPGLSLSAQACESCHSGSHREWAGSRHALASTNALFTASFAKQTRTWCLNCHAPLAEQRVGKPPRVALTELGKEGVSCAACHLREGLVLSGRAPTPEGQNAHPMAQAALGSELCASCHDFNIPWVNLPRPIHRHGYSGVPMQDTYDEWKSSDAARRGIGCVSCHMPNGSHAVTGARDVAWLTRVLRVEARAGKGVVDVSLFATGVAHGFPTGDPFRVLRFELCDGDTCRTRRLGKSLIEGRPSMTIPPATTGDEAVLRFAMPGRGTRWRLSYWLPEPELAATLAPEDRELELLRGEVVTGPRPR